MRVIPPLTITDARLTSSSIAEPDTGEVVWVATANYAVGTTVIRTTTHRKYECQIAGVDATLPELATTRWLDVGPTNRYAMFDMLRSSATVAPLTLTTVLTPGERVDSIALLGMVADSASFTMTSAAGGGIVYDSGMINLRRRRVFGWRDFLYAPFIRQPSAIFFDLPPYSDATITITLTISSGNVECGACVIGRQVYIGAVQYDAESTALNFSTVTRDFAGNVNTMTPRRNVPQTIQRIECDKSRVDSIYDLRNIMAGRPGVWSALDDSTSDGYFAALLILGFYTKFTINVRDPLIALASLDLEEI
ncbi:MAG TPA: hypothetical protein VIF37_06420 [Methylobacter sp.]